MSVKGVCSTAWDLEAFLALDEEQREAIIEALRDDVNKLCSEMPDDDPMVARLRDELQVTLDHYYKLLQMSQKEPGTTSVCQPLMLDVYFKRVSLQNQTTANNLTKK